MKEIGRVGLAFETTINDSESVLKKSLKSLKSFGQYK